MGKEGMIPDKDYSQKEAIGELHFTSEIDLFVFTMEILRRGGVNNQSFFRHPGLIDMLYPDFGR